MNCEWREQLDLYADGELPVRELGKLQDHLRSCSSCAASALSRMQMKRSIHTAAANAFSPAAEFRLQLQNSILGTRRAAPRWWPVLSFSAAFSAAIIVAIILTAVILPRHTTQQDVLAEVIDLHVSTLASANPVDVVSTDRHTVKPWFQGKVPFTFNLPELQNSDFRLVGGRMAYIEQSPAAQLLFTVRKHQLSVFILQNSEDVEKRIGRETKERRLQFSVDTWAQGGLRYLVISDAGQADVETLSNLLRSSAQ